jgi:hypothetical protein
MTKKSVEWILPLTSEPILRLEPLLSVPEAELFEAEHHDAANLSKKTLELFDGYTELLSYLLIGCGAPKALLDAMIGLLNLVRFKPERSREPIL